MNRTYQWLLFDADNTLLDFDATERYGLLRMFEDIGLTWQDAYIDTYHQINRAAWRAFEDGQLHKSQLRTIRFERFFEAIGYQGIDPKTCSDSYLTHIAETDFLVEGAKETLDAASNGYSLGLVTNGLKEVQRPRLRRAGIYDYFEVIVVSDEIGPSKPDRAFFEHCFAQMETTKPHQSLIIGDNLNSDIKGGQQFGMDTCWYNIRQQQNDTDIQPTYEIKHLNEFKNWLVEGGA